MAIALDASSKGTVVSTTLTFAHTCTGSNLVLLVGVFKAVVPDDITGVTYNTVALSRISGIFDSNLGFVYLYGLVGPATGNHNIVISGVGGAGTLRGMGVSYTGVLQSGLPDSHGENNIDTGASPITTSTTVIASNCWLAGVAFKNLQGNIAAGTGTNLVLAESDGFNGIFDSNGTVGTGSQSLQATWTGGNDNIGFHIASIAPASAGGGTTFTPVISIL